MIDGYSLHLVIIICVYLILSLSLQLSVGFAGLLNLGHIAFFAIGAYTYSILALAGAPFWISLVASVVLPMFFAYLLSIATNKLKGDYLALATLGFSFLIYSLALNWMGLTNGPMGIAGIPRPEFLGVNFSNSGSFLILLLVFTVLSFFAIQRITKSPFGRVVQAVRDDELAARTLGKNAAKVKNSALMISALFAGIAGAFYASYITYIDPGSFSFSALIPILVIVVIGGLASLEGTVLATIIIVLLPEPLRFLGLSSSLIGPGRQILYALFLLLILIYKPRGFYGKVNLE